MAARPAEFVREPEWWRGAVVYQIYPRSFQDSDGDGVGDLRGVVERLPYLESLGVDAIWLSPFYPSPMADFGYDVADYTDVDPLFGTLRDAERLIEHAHARGIKVLLDWVPNHSSDRHPWFLASRSSRDDPKRDWYLWRDGRPGGRPPDRSTSAFARVGGVWTLDEATNQWYRHEFTPGQPDLNWANPELAEAMLGTLRFWLDRGVDGFRIDVAHRIPHEVLRRVRGVLEEYDGRVAVGEVYLLDQAELVRFLVTGDELHLAHNFVFLRAPWRADALRRIIDEFERLSTPVTWPSWCLENHDHSRVATRYDEGGHGPARARAALLMLLALRGTAFVYEGQELGLPDARGAAGGRRRCGRPRPRAGARPLGAALGRRARGRLQHRHALVARRRGRRAPGRRRPGGRPALDAVAVPPPDGGAAGVAGAAGRRPDDARRRRRGARLAARGRRGAVARRHQHVVA